jgi:7-keto-8-aminopelargonate synthetase-like enzyme
MEERVTHSGADFAPARLTESADESVRNAEQAGVIMQSADNIPYRGRHVTIGGAELLNFGSCSYLGLEQRPELIEGAVDAVRAFGTQFSFSRAYVESPLYTKLEHALAAITEGHPLVAASTTLGHIAALPVLVGPKDHVIIDQFAHASIHTAVALLRGVATSVVRHNRMDLLEEKIGRLSAKHPRVWYLADGVYSMLGGFAPVQDLARLLARYPQLHLYLDDAHATSWVGRHGRGHCLDGLPDRSRVTVALSLNKAFSAAGGVIVFASEEDRGRVRRCGGPMVFSGPIQPPMLGAAVASATLHLLPDFGALQRSLMTRIDLVLRLAKERELPLAATDRSPIFFIQCGEPSATFALTHALRARGIYVSPSVFPAVPHNQSGVRFTVTLHNREEDVRLLIGALAEEYDRAVGPTVHQSASRIRKPGG